MEIIKDQAFLQSSLLVTAFEADYSPEEFPNAPRGCMALLELDTKNILRREGFEHARVRLLKQMRHDIAHISRRQ